MSCGKQGGRAGGARDTHAAGRNAVGEAILEPQIGARSRLSNQADWDRWAESRATAPNVSVAKALAWCQRRRNQRLATQTSNPAPIDSEITAQLARWSEGDAEALAAFFPQAYDQLYAIARRLCASERPDRTRSPWPVSPR